MRVGIYGGSFDPVHRGHVAVAKAVLAARRPAWIELIPAAAPPHKPRGCHAPFPHRLAMLRLALQGEGPLIASDREGRREGRSYSIDTVEEVAAEHPDASIELLVGSDMLADLPTWRRARELLERVTLIAFERPGMDGAEARRQFRAAFGAQEEARIVPVAVPAVEASSTAIRGLLAIGRDPGPLLPPGVLDYILEMKLYRG